MIDIAKFETFRNFTILNKALLFLIKLNKTAVQSISIYRLLLNLTRFLPDSAASNHNSATSNQNSAVSNQNSAASYQNSAVSNQELTPVL